MSQKTTARTRPRKIETSENPWEKGDLGRDVEHAAVAQVDATKIDRALDLVPVSIRLQRSLIQDYKDIAELNGLGYQTLMRQILTRFAEAEKKRLLREAASAQREMVREERKRKRA